MPSPLFWLLRYFLVFSWFQIFELTMILQKYAAAISYLANNHDKTLSDVGGWDQKVEELHDVRWSSAVVIFGNDLRLKDLASLRPLLLLQRAKYRGERSFQAWSRSRRWWENLRYVRCQISMTRMAKPKTRMRTTTNTNANTDNENKKLSIERHPATENEYHSCQIYEQI